MVVLVHGLFVRRRQLLPEAQFLAKHGYGVLVFDNRAHGDSGGSTATWGLRERGNVERAVDFVQQPAEAPAGKIGLLGFSIGGTAVLREAIGDAPVAGVVVEVTYSSMGGEIACMFSKYGPLSELSSLWTAQTLGGLDYAQLVPEDLEWRLKPRPLLLIYGTHDSDVPPAEGQRVANAACQPSSLLMINTDTHGGYLDAEPDTYSNHLSAFFDVALSPVRPGG